MNITKHRVIVIAVAATCGLALTLAAASKVRTVRASNQHSVVAQRDDAGAAAAFESMVTVLHHPRCMNCHSTGDFPRQGDDGHRHTMNVRRGIEGQGVPGLKCSTCHQDHNLVGEHMPPGAPDWHLPSAHEPMIWEGLSDRRLCELLKDPAQNG